MNNTSQTLDAAYATALEQATNPRQRQSLERIKAACDYLETSGLKISPSTVERYCLDREWDGPKAQSIRNSKDRLMRYLQLRQSGQQWNKPAKSGSNEPIITDESLRAYVQLLKEERDQALAAKARIEAGLRKIPGVSVDAILRNEAQPRNTLSPPETINPVAAKAIASLFNAEHLRSCGLEYTKDRVRHGLTKNVLIEKDEVLALRSLLPAG